VIAGGPEAEEGEVANKVTKVDAFGSRVETDVGRTLGRQQFLHSGIRVEEYVVADLMKQSATFKMLEDPCH